MSKGISEEPLICNVDSTLQVKDNLYRKRQLVAGVTRKQNIPGFDISERPKCAILTKKDGAIQSEVLELS